MRRIVTLTDVPDAEVTQVVADFKSEGATVAKTKQENGMWTVVATFRTEDLSVRRSAGIVPSSRVRPRKRKRDAK